MFFLQHLRLSAFGVGLAIGLVIALLFGAFGQNWWQAVGTVTTQIILLTVLVTLLRFGELTSAKKWELSIILGIGLVLAGVVYLTDLFGQRDQLPLVAVLSIIFNAAFILLVAEIKLEGRIREAFGDLMDNVKGNGHSSPVASHSKPDERDVDDYVKSGEWGRDQEKKQKGH